MEVAEAFPALATLDPRDLEPLTGMSRRARFHAGQTLFQPEQACRNYLFVFDGAVRVQKIGENGRVILLYRVEAGETCLVTTSCLMSAQSYSGEGVVERDLDCAMLPETTVQTLMGRSALFRSFVFSSFADRMADLLSVIRRTLSPHRRPARTSIARPGKEP
ncbi:MAG: CRP/FNR family transcriptional regulator, anaerobic regulatory protein [Stygiobacter sp.]|nr:MAG: CRP/FNR family transcriptional regulator, anaerobic regulatory protein [Stygiobacter sp.]